MTPEKGQNNSGGSRLQRSGGRTSGPQKSNAKPTSRQKALRVVYVVVTVLAALVVVVFAVSRLLFVKPTVPATPQVPNLPPASSEDPERLDGETPSVYGSGRKEDFFTFLVIGRDTGGGGNTDTILLAAYDVPNQQLNVMSIPRDTMVNVSWDIKRINSVYNMYGGGDDGLEALGDEISQLVGFVPDFQVVVEWEAVGELVEALGGVWYDVPRDMYYWDPTQDLLIDVDAGYQKLNGDQAMQVVRFRDGPNGYNTGDLGRIETQQGFLKAVVKQCLQITNVTRIGQLAQVFTDNVTTNLTIPNLLWFAQQAILGNDASKALDMESVNFVTMPCTTKNVWSRSYGNKQSYVVPNTSELVDLVNDCFNPYLEDLSSKELDIMYVNSDGTIGSSTGVLEDRTHNSAWLEHKNRPVSTPEPTESGLPEESGSPDPSASPDPDASFSPSASPSPGVTGSPDPTPSAAPSPSPSEGTEATQSPPPAESPTETGPDTPVIDPGTPVLTPPPGIISTPTPAPDAGTQDGPPEGIPLL